MLNQRACSTNIKLANKQSISTSETHATMELERVLQDTGVPLPTNTRTQMFHRGNLEFRITIKQCNSADFLAGTYELFTARVMLLAMS